jgi:hypothetical protein
VIGLLEKLGELIGEEIDLGDLPKEASSWAESVNALAEGDSDISQYVHHLEAAKDAVDAPEASGEAIAQEFQRYLERRERGGGKDGPGIASR